MQHSIGLLIISRLNQRRPLQKPASAAAHQQRSESQPFRLPVAGGRLLIGEGVRKHLQDFQSQRVRGVA